ncbi:TVP38/TMEM64 family protein [Viridibacillus arvi]|uniref:TVP38/TMEM64 family protein n=1 Tax=Viridibacillus arvi TaxID=263475 RepID=UPI00187B7F76|nr:VTT domain-containing protein [Viridibacillus sp. JNUCC-6]QOV11179.1 TVP38/TMEM64 family protein [Viridibacillus sp. JNUCC-6]
MEIQIIELFENTGIYAVWLSIILSIVISILGIVPSIFLTVANIGFFGFGYGLLLSILGEAFGAIISFYLFRKGLNKVTNKVSVNNKILNKLQETEGIKAFTLVLALRLAPFMPSGLITLVSAGSKMGILNFSIASTLGKIPALIIEAYSIKEILDWDWQGKIILGILSIFIFILMFRKKRRLAGKT